MNKTIGIIPTIIEKNKSLFFSLDYGLLNFLKKCFSEYEQKFLINKNDNIKLDLIVSVGGNTITLFDKNSANKFRADLDEFYLKLSLKNEIPYLGICHGAQFLANFFDSYIKKKNNHVKKNHKIKLYSGSHKIVNSYHNFAITKLGKKLIKIACAEDGSIEAFKHFDKRILGIMWHPERYKKIKKFDLQFIKKNL